MIHHSDVKKYFIHLVHPKTLKSVEQNMGS